jgi:hypothetical protein
MVSDVSLVWSLFDIGPQSRHKFHITEITLFPFELEVAVHGDVEGIQPPGQKKSQRMNVKEINEATHSNGPAISQSSGIFRPG